MRRLRKRFWDALFFAATRLSNYALVKRSKACGCSNCTNVAMLMAAMKRASRAPLSREHPAGLN